MEIKKPLDRENAVVFGTDGGLGPTGVPNTTAAAEGSGESGCSMEAARQQRPDPPVPEKPVRRRFGAEYKARILKEADQLTEPGQLGALLRREGLYSPHLSVWRKQRDEAALAGLVPMRRGRKPDSNAALVAENQGLARENARLMRKLRLTEAILDVQKKLSEILGIELPPNDYVNEP